MGANGKMSVMLSLPTEKPRWLTRKDKGGVVGISPLVARSGTSVGETLTIILETKLGGWEVGRKRQDKTGQVLV